MRKYVNPQGKTSIKVTPELFVEVWTASSSSKEAGLRLGMSQVAVAQPACVYRKLGVVLKRFPRKALPPQQKLDITRLNHIINATEDKLARRLPVLP